MFILSDESDSMDDVPADEESVLSGQILNFLQQKSPSNSKAFRYYGFSPE
jgi:hypothetical protein